MLVIIKGKYFLNNFHDISFKLATGGNTAGGNTGGNTAIVQKFLRVQKWREVRLA